ncbi:MAG: hypothetical protein PHE50_08545 [Dehalococcoidales bacterium]|nr:hypothetical protein [Dehalococcoidales bacterium]
MRNRLLITAVILLNTVIFGVSCKSDTKSDFAIKETWTTASNRAYGYQIRCPGSWEIRFSGLPNLKGGLTIDGQGILIQIAPFQITQTDNVSDIIDNEILANSNYSTYRILGHTNTIWQGHYQATEWMVLSQLSPPELTVKSIRLYVIRDMYIYRVVISTKESDYELYAGTIETIIHSFKTTQPEFTSLYPAPPKIESVVLETGGATDVSYSPVFSWIATPGAISYQFEITEDTESENKFTVVNYEATTLTNSYQIPLDSSLKPGTKYWWRVRAMYQNGDAGNWKVSSFTTIHRAVSLIVLS